MAIKKLSKVNLTLLTAIVVGTQSSAGMAYATQDEVNALLKERPGSVEINTGIVDPSDAKKFATRATASGIAELPTDQATAATDKANEAPKGKIEVLTGVTRPEKARGGNIRGEVYPFLTIPVDGCFFLANTTEKPDMAKSIASTIGSANLRFAKAAKVGDTYRVFGVYRGPDPSFKADPATPDDKAVEGALIFREADATMTTDLRAKLDKPKEPKEAAKDVAAATGAEGTTETAA